MGQNTPILVKKACSPSSLGESADPTQRACLDMTVDNLTLLFSYKMPISGPKNPKKPLMHAKPHCIMGIR